MGGRRRLLGVIVVVAVVVAALLWRRHGETVAVGVAADPTGKAVAPRQAGPGHSAPMTGEHVAGHVFFAGKPFTGAVVELLGAAHQVLGSVMSGPDGGFDLGARPAGRLEVVARAPGMRAASKDVRREKAANDLRLDLGDCAARLDGTVRDPDGGAIVGARVFVSTFAARRAYAITSVGAAISDATGAIHVCTSSGTLQLKVTADGYATLIEDIVVSGTSRHDFVLGPEALVTGRVVAEPDGAPLAGADVSVYPSVRSLSFGVYAEALSDEGGAFVASHLPPGRYEVSCSLEGYYGRGRVAVVAKIGAAASAECRLTRGLEVTGRVVGPEDKPLGSGEIVGSFAEGATRADIDSEGRFRLLGVPPGRLTLRVPDYEVVEPETLEVTQDTADVTVRVRAPSVASLAGRVVRRGVGVAGAAVEYRTPGPPFRNTVTTDADGGFVLSPLRPGTQGIRVMAEAIPAAASRRIDLEPGEAKTGVVIELGYTATVSGVVVDEGGKPQASVYVYLSCDEKNDEGNATTAADGSFRILYLSGGCTYKPVVKASAEAGSRFAVPAGGGAPAIDVPTEDSHIEGVRLVISRATARISGRVVDGTGAGVEDAAVIASQGGWSAARSVTRSDGTFEIGEVPLGSYLVQAAAPGRIPVRVEDVAAGRSEVVITVPAEASVHGRLVGFAELPSWVTMSGATTMNGANVARDGTFVFEGLSAGEAITLTAESSGSVAAQSIPLFPGENAVTLTASPVARLEGVLVDASGAAITQASCSMRAPGVRFRRVPVDAGGRFGIEAPVGSVVTLTCSLFDPPDRTARWTDVVPAEGRTDLRLTF